MFDFHIAKGRIGHTFTAFKFKNFRLIWIGNLTSNIGSWMQNVAQPWLVLSLSQSAFLLGLDAFAQDAPLLAFLLVGGALADRKSRRTIIAISQTVQLVTALCLALLIYTGQAHVWIVILFSFIVGTVQAFSIPAYQALITNLVDRPYLSNAIALNSMQFNLSRIIGPVIAGAVMSTLGLTWCFSLNALSFVAMLYAMWKLNLVPIKKPHAKSNSLAAILGGVKEITQSRQMLGILLVVAATGLFCGPLITFIPIFAKDVYQTGARGFSQWLAMFGFGALTGALFLASDIFFKQSWKSVVGFGVLLAATVSLIGIVPSFGLSFPLLFLAGFAYLGCNASAQSILQSSVSDEFRGRTASIYVLALRGGVPLGNLVTGLTVSHFGIRSAIFANGTLSIFTLLWIANFWLKEKIAVSQALPTS